MLLQLHNRVRSACLQQQAVYKLSLFICFPDTDLYHHSQFSPEQEMGDPHVKRRNDLARVDAKSTDYYKPPIKRKRTLPSPRHGSWQIGKLSKSSALVTNIFNPPQIDTGRNSSKCAANWTAPWQVGLMFLTSNWKTKLCGGVLVHRLWVLTAAHCLDNTILSLVMVGSKNYYEGFLREGQVKAVEETIIHERYSGSTGSQPPLHDIALLKLSTSVVLGPDVSPARIPRRNSSLLSHNTEMVISGWGFTENSHSSQERLHCARVHVSHCQMAYNGSRVKIHHNSHVCAGYSNSSSGAGSASPCHGDSGGGLVHCGPDGNNTVIGIISWSLRCGSQYSVYTNVPQHESWLLANAPELAETEGQVN